ncbi:phosphatase PAP2 family protein [Microbacterium sp. gxy059]|uniref:phosphatase PAP2 family protein n=1 Tax=Microbacterium sp. gxy059 TaxID=2957199 RepID=UPI003D98AFCB
MPPAAPPEGIRGPRFLLALGALLIGLGALLGLAVAIGGEEPPLDTAWNRLMGDARAAAPLVDVAHVLDRAGGGWIGTWVVPLVFALVVALFWRGRAAVFAVAAMAASALAVQGVKHLIARPRPEDMLVTSDFGSFPSGHTAHAATIAAVLVILAPRAWAYVVGALWTLAMALSRTLLGAHWLTDTLGGALIGAGTACAVAGFLFHVAGLGEQGRRPDDA